MNCHKRSTVVISFYVLTMSHFLAGVALYKMDFSPVRMLGIDSQKDSACIHSAKVA